MAKNKGKVYLGYEEETISERNKLQLNYTINKIGGLPVRIHFKLLYLQTKKYVFPL